LQCSTIRIPTGLLIASKIKTRPIVMVYLFAVGWTIYIEFRFMLSYQTNR